MGTLDPCGQVPKATPVQRRAGRAPGTQRVVGVRVVLGSSKGHGAPSQRDRPQGGVWGTQAPGGVTLVTLNSSSCELRGYV